MPRTKTNGAIDPDKMSDEQAFIEAFHGLHDFKKAVEDMDVFNEGAFQYLEAQEVTAELYALYDSMRDIYRRVIAGGKIVPPGWGGSSNGDPFPFTVVPDEYGAAQ